MNRLLGLGLLVLGLLGLLLLDLSPLGLGGLLSGVVWEGDKETGDWVWSETGEWPESPIQERKRIKILMSF